MANYIMTPVNENNISILNDFIQNLGKSKLTFRYYETRELSVIKQHLCTYVIISEHKSVGYGHLEEEDGKLWLGIAIVEDYTGHGLGKVMMNQLINTASENQKKEIHLTVDKNNKVAISMYKKIGFSLVKELNTTTLLLNYKND